MKSLNVGGQLISLENPVVMGILNITEDSFHDGGKYLDVDVALTQCRKMIEEGAAIIDIGASSTRPGAETLDSEVEIGRIEPVLKELKTQFPDAVISLDTYHMEVVRHFSDDYAFIANDVKTANQSSEYLECVAQNNLPYICMHMQGEPSNMQDAPSYDDVAYEVLSFFSDKVYNLHQRGINQVVLDPGFGFGKTIDHNYELLRKLNVFNILDKPVLAGVSRKSMIYKHLDITPGDRA